MTAHALLLAGIYVAYAAGVIICYRAARRDDKHRMAPWKRHGWGKD